MLLALLLLACGGTAPGSPEADPLATNGPAETTNDSTTVPDAATEPSVEGTRLPVNSPEPNPSSIEVTYDEGSAHAAAVGPEGGVLETEDAGGHHYRLTILEGALISPEEITMTPIASADGEVMGDLFLAGISLQPAGLHFLELVTIEISGPAIEAGAVGFGAEHGGQDVYLVGTSQSGDTLTIRTAHFSEFGACNEQFAENMQAFVPLNMASWVEQLLATGSDEAIARYLADQYGTFWYWSHTYEAGDVTIEAIWELFSRFMVATG
jgi:hypothetical protein